MKKLIAFVLLSFFFHLMGFSQEVVLKGTVSDTLGHTDLDNAVVYLKRTEDSSLVAFTRAAHKGVFTISGLARGIYMLVVNYPGYLTWIDSIRIGDQSLVQVAVYMMTRAHLLEEVVVHQTMMPIRIKGDTTEFLADSFHLRPGATVEDMLRVLPGMSVDAKGRITADGERVENVLVDGEEFFGNDPTIATRNLNKSDIAKVQLYDKKSDQAAITGINDGVKQKTINLVLKEDAKKGYFGEVAGSSDLNKYYQGKATISRFTSTLQTGALIVADRTGGHGPVSTYGDDNFGTNDGSGEGIPESIQGAAMFNKKFGLLRSSTANNFGYTHLNIIGNKYTENKYILPDTVYYTNQRSGTKMSSWQERLNSKNIFNLDSLTTLTVAAKLTNGKNTNSAIVDGATLGNDNFTYINKSHRTDNSFGDNNTADAELYLKRQFNKSGNRFLTVGAEIKKNNYTTEDYLYNKTEYYYAGSITGQEIVDQKKTNSNQSITAEALVSYVTPISKKLSVNVNYAFNTSNSDQDIRSYENRNGKYDSLNLLYSNHYKFINTSNQGGWVINFDNQKQITGRIGLALQGVSLKQTDIFTNSTNNRIFYNIFPSLSLGWKYSSSSRLTFSYNGGTR
ncbi:MAG TPA: outer membrane beta-barrel protein, partial [Sediminibacterium sp.]|nr:outer membrane beta-barrel protein [Sediminibacterium sp.]